MKMTKNVDLELNLEDDVLEDLMALFIRNYLSDASLEVFERERPRCSLREAAGHAMLNEALIHAIETGIAYDDVDFLLPPEMSQEFDDELVDALVATGHKRPVPKEERITIELNGEMRDYYPVGYKIDYDEIAIEVEIENPLITYTRASGWEGELTPASGGALLLEDGMVINARWPDATETDKVSILINGIRYYYPVGHDIGYDEIAFHAECTQPTVTVSSPQYGANIMSPTQVVTVEEGMIINAFDTNNA